MIIYRLISPSGKSYIGLTIFNFKKRWKAHLVASKHKPHIKLYKAFNKYHLDIWTHEILFETDNHEELCKKEIEFIQQYDSIQNGYNSCSGGEGGWIGMKHSEESKKKMSNSQIGNKNNLGRKHSIKTKIKMSAAKKNKPRSQKSIDSCSHNYIIETPNGESIQTKNLKKYCRDNNISNTCMHRVIRGKLPNYKGYKCKKC